MAVATGRVRIENAASARIFRALRFDERFLDDSTLLFERPTVEDFAGDRPIEMGN
jgi:hypothetical protein